MDKAGSSALYFRGPQEDYSTERRVIHPFSVDDNPQDLVFELQDNPREIEAIRLHFLLQEPPNGIAYIKLYTLCVDIVDKKTNQTTSVVTLHNDAEFRTRCTLFGLAFNNRILGDLYAVEDKDPGMEFRIPELPVDGRQASLVVTISVEYLPGDGYIFARDQFLVRQEQWGNRIHSLESRLADLEKTKIELENHKRSPLWVRFVQAQSYYDRIMQWKRDGALNSCLKLFQPAWWSRRHLTGYERWRENNGYRNRNEK